MRPNAHARLGQLMQFRQVQHQESPVEYKILTVLSIPLLGESQLHPYSSQECSPAIYFELRKLFYKFPPERMLLVLPYFRLQSDFE